MDGIETLLRRNVREVFGQHDAAARRRAIAEIFAENCVFTGPAGHHRGHGAVDEAVAVLQARLPDHVFADGAVHLLDDAGLLEWTFGPPDDPGRIAGTDVALVSDGRIERLLAFVKP